MNEEELIRKLASRAQMEEPPLVDVAARVMTILNTEPEREEMVFGPFAWIVAAGAVVATPIVLIALTAWSSLQDSLIENFNVLTWVIT